jgi:hypothetical protein
MADVAITEEFRNWGKGIADLEADLVAVANASQSFYNSGDVIAIIKNGSGGSITVTVEGVADENGHTVDEVHTIAAGKIAFISFMKVSMFNSSGKVTLTYSAITTVTQGLYRLRNQ